MKVFYNIKNLTTGTVHGIDSKSRTGSDGRICKKNGTTWPSGRIHEYKRTTDPITCKQCLRMIAGKFNFD